MTRTIKVCNDKNVVMDGYNNNRKGAMQDKENDFTIAWNQVTESAVKRVDEMSNDELDILADIFKDFK